MDADAVLIDGIAHRRVLTQREAFDVAPAANGSSARVDGGGNGGEIYRGFFYQYFGMTGVAPKGTIELADRLLSWRFRRTSKLPFVDARSAAGVRDRLLEALMAAERCSSDPYDMADLLYLFERYGRWGSAPAALPWQRAGRRSRASPGSGKRLVGAASSSSWTPLSGKGWP